MNPSLEPRRGAGRPPRHYHDGHSQRRHAHRISHEPGQQPISNLPTHRSIVVVDVVAFTRPDRDNVDQLAIRAAMYDTLRDAFEDSGIPWRRTVREDRGDGVLIFVPAEVSKVLLLGKMPARLAELLDGGNATRPLRQRFRLRMVVHAGEVHRDAHGFAGYDVNLAFRLVDAKPLREAMEHGGAPLGLIVSENVHDAVVRHGYGGIDPEAFERVRVQVKSADVPGWIRLVPQVAALPVPRRPAAVPTDLAPVGPLGPLGPLGAVAPRRHGPVAVLLADEASLLDDLAGLGVDTVVLVAGAAGLAPDLAPDLAPIARQPIYIEHELIE